MAGLLLPEKLDRYLDGLVPPRQEELDQMERYGKRFCISWHADFYRPPPRWWRRLHWPEDDGYTGGGGCCG